LTLTLSVFAIVHDMETLMLTTSTRRGVPTRGMCIRYGVKHPRTIRRWEIQGVIPPPDFVINNRKYWWESTLDQHDRRTVAARVR
jgi:hypothetical protein